jgi:hypothetical protein
MTFSETRYFIQIWYECETFTEFCARMGMDKRTAANRAAHIRRKKIPLKKLRTSGGSHGASLTSKQWEEIHRWANACKAASEILKYRENQNGRPPSALPELRE